MGFMAQGKKIPVLHKLDRGTVKRKRDQVWIDYFREGKHDEKRDQLIRLILTELIPALLHRNQKDLIEALLALPCVPYYSGS